ncbi:Uncharacterized protein FWK35_00016636 [Aphis craccivora]|uniref:Uncharacterized protein n=1 Tax=Aphis craccivora TaxID=307492 RepID=A0A6G0WTQ6_APHCR|nr:Uncharacterized protein FWK35_00036023 [Aphis craccivora]KAF0730824.1 Uncharacterized protein FWK35_00036022 [Aphis craccivora]KAF0755867.1 Uncharacterized protein FWK35_00016636 [Aphis craccivora]
MALAYTSVNLSAFIENIALPVVMSICGKIFKQVMTPYQYTLGRTKDFGRVSLL